MEKEKTKTTKKTGSTPVVEEGLGGGKVMGVLKVEMLLVKYIDGHGEEATKLGIRIPGGDLYFLTRDAVDTRPAQTWLRAAVDTVMGE